MLNSLVTFFTNSSSPNKIPLEYKKSINVQKNIIYRDELSKKKPTKTKPIKKGNYNPDYSLEGSEPLINKEVVRVKVKMTKEEANRLLSKCKDGGVLEFRDVARELVNIPMNRIVVSDNLPSNCCSATVLKTIPEEF